MSTLTILSLLILLGVWAIAWRRSPRLAFGMFIGVGIAWMFYGKPWLARRQAAQALAAHRARESGDDAKPADPVSAGA